MADSIVTTTVRSPTADIQHGGYTTRALDSHLASMWPDILDVAHRVARRHPDATTFRYGDTGHTTARERRVYVRRRPHYGVREDYVIVDHGGRFGAVPASESEIAKLPAVTASEVRESDCAVCLESFQEGETLRMMACPSTHGFHESCIVKWLRVSRLCPLCRFALPAE